MEIKNHKRLDVFLSFDDHKKLRILACLNGLTGKGELAGKILRECIHKESEKLKLKIA
jgi:hypothetical protein